MKVLEEILYSPIFEMKSRPSKAFRAELVGLGCAIGLFDDVSESPSIIRSKSKDVALVAEIIEELHLASLIVDDIQDASTQRRGKESLHLLIGMPLALNAGNWLYFEALAKAMQIESANKDLILQVLILGMREAHKGQALDLGFKIWDIPQDEIYEYCQQSLSLKSGVLLGMAIESGLLLSDSAMALEKREEVQRLGIQLGFSLQVWDDVGNFSVGIKGLSHPKYSLKNLEDIALARPTWVWAVAAKELSPEDFKEWVNLAKQLSQAARTDWTKMISSKAAQDFLSKTGLLELSLKSANSISNDLVKLKNELVRCEATKKKIVSITERIANAYI